MNLKERSWHFVSVLGVVFEVKFYISSIEFTVGDFRFGLANENSRIKKSEPISQFHCPLVGFLCINCARLSHQPFHRWSSLPGI